MSPLIPLLLVLTGIPLISNAQEQEQEQILPLEELRAFNEVYYYVKSSYVEEVDDKTLINAAIKGMVSSLDSHSRYLEAADLRRFNADNNGEYAGIGVSFLDHKQGIEIKNVVKNSPADRQNLHKGMVITKINDIAIQQISSDDANKLLSGEVGSPVKLTLINTEQQQKPLTKDYWLTREIVQLPSVTSDLLSSGVGYCAISQFTKKTPAEFIDAITEMSAGHPMKKLIIDLRNNLGGSLESAIEISDFFIDSGILLTSVGRTHDANEVFEASKMTPYKNLQLIVIINEYSASSSEILAAALQDHHRATILGNTSYGKGSIQSMYFLQHKTGLKITTAKYYSPNGRGIQGIGVQPDIVFKTAGLENNQNTKTLDDLEVLQAFQLILKQ